jgi:hypothetical protein
MKKARKVSLAFAGGAEERAYGEREGLGAAQGRAGLAAQSSAEHDLDLA